MKPKLLCSDLDGTLLITKSDVSEFTIAQLNRVKRTVRIILVSARMPSGMRYLQKRLNIEKQPIICYNGALIIDNEKEVHSTTIPLNIVHEISNHCAPLKTALGLYYKDEWYVPESSERVEKEIKYTRTKAIFRPTSETITDWQARDLGAHKIMLMGTKESSDILIPILNEKLGSSINIYRSNDTLIEIAPKTVSKLTAIKQLLKPTETLADVLAFGDNYNDLEMLSHCGIGVAVGNARAELKRIADYVTVSNTENGVAEFIKHHLVI
ncbi:Cof-type HAD-IIB family hydrolase [Maribacter aestuarii]|uniref:Cof-type HAD-IIB family hydrolase n=1 Tax=Maribacter aestuarii TaxID=1130723 RepID=UPI00248C4FBD|nr:Cof-type HAD-IIB family hydrolase [Maribacter aestuarii]